MAPAIKPAQPTTPPVDSPQVVQEQEFFDTLVKDNGSFNPFTPGGWAKIERRFVEFCDPATGTDLLDIGCGTGESRKLYAKHVTEYTGVDLSSASIEFARQRIPEANWQVANACELPFDDESFDIVAFSSVLHHIDDYLDALREAYRVLKPGGQVFAFDPNVFHPAMALLRKPESPFYLSRGVSPNERPLQPSALRKNFAAAGFDEVRQRCQSGIPYREVGPPIVNFALPAYNLVDHLCEAVGLGRWIGTFAITAATKPESGDEPQPGQL